VRVDKNSITASFFSQPAKTTKDTIIIAKPDIKDLNIRPTTFLKYIVWQVLFYFNGYMCQNLLLFA
jgi:hypothetical protein